MKRTESNTSVKTIPDGAYEAGTVSAKPESNSAASNDPGIDLQGNGYPDSKNRK